MPVPCCSTVSLPTPNTCDPQSERLPHGTLRGVTRGHRTVYMPVYRGAEALNDAAEAVWRRLGWDVRRVDCTDAYRHFGSLRCLVNVLSRRATGGSSASGRGAIAS